jgi:hypothetical protein
MVKQWMIGVLAAGFLTGLCGGVKADEISELRREMENQYEAMRQIHSRLIELEAKQKEQDVAVKKLESSGALTIPETLKWAEKISFYGDFRYRHEMIDAQGSTPAGDGERHRHRIRARLGLKGKINEEWSFDLRIATGNDDSPISTNQDLDNGFSSKDIWLDRAFLTYTPKAIEGFSVVAGKMGIPFVTVGGNQLIWDGDLTPEGAAVNYTARLTETTNLFANAGGMWVEERSSDTDTSLWGVQGGLIHAFADKSKLTGGASYFKYGNIQGKPAIGSFAGNTSQGGVYKYDYELLELFGDYTTRLGETPVSLYGDYVVNTASGVSADTGWLLGTVYNKAKDPGSWEISYDYRELERDAVLGAFTDSDFIGGGTHGKGHRFSFKYALAKNVATGVTYFLNERDGDNTARTGARDDKYRRLQLDVELKF